MIIGGFIPLSLIDWDGQPCSVIFVRGCNLRCPWCHNAELVTGSNLPKTDFNFINMMHNKNTIDHICITGGEPTFYQEHLEEFCWMLKDHNFKIKLDTNGTNPKMLFNLIISEVIDYIAMDVKAPLIVDKYDVVSGMNAEHLVYYIADSIDIIKRFSVDYEFRTTVIPGLHTVKDIEQIAKYALKGAKKYVIQNFRPSDTLIDPKFANVKPFTAEQLEEFASAAKPYVKNVKIRNS